MKRKLNLLALAALFATQSWAGTRVWNFDDWPYAVTNLTLASSQADPLSYVQYAGGNPEGGGFLELTPAAGGRNLEVIFPDIDGGAPVKAFKITADMRVGNGTETPADGFSISYVRDSDVALSNALNVVYHAGTDPVYDPTIGLLKGFAGGDSLAAAQDPAGGTNPESGTKTGVSISFDAWKGNWLPDGTGGAPGNDIVGISVRVDDVTLIQKTMTDLNQGCTNSNSMQTGPYDTNAPNAWQGLGWCKLEVEKTADNKVNVTWKGVKILDNYQLTSYSIHKGRLILAGRTGGSWQNVHFDNITLDTVPGIEPTFNGLTVNPDVKGWTFTLLDTPPSLATNVSQVLWNGVDVTASVSVSKTGNLTTGVYTQGTRLPSGGTNQVAVTFKSSLGQTLSGVGNATTPAYVVLPTANALPLSAVSGQPRGIVLGQTYQTLAPNINSQGDNRLNWTEEQLLGLHGPNLITGSWPTTADILDYQNDNPLTFLGNGNFRQDPLTNTPPLWYGADFAISSLGFGSNPAKANTDDGTIEWFAYVNFPVVGTYYMVVNSDDGFRLTTARNAKDRLGSVISYYEGGRGNGTGLDAGPIARLEVDAAGVYPIRGFIENQGGGFNVEWYTRDGTNLYLVNSNSTPQSLQAWQSATGAGCYVQSAVPVRDAIDVAGNQKIIIDLANGTASVNAGSIALKVDGALVSPVFTGLHMELPPIGPGGLWVSGSKHTNELTFTDSASTTYSYKWSFTVAPYVVLPLSLHTAPGTGADPGVRIKMWQKSPLPASPNPENIINGWRNMLALGNQVAEGFYPTNAADLSTYTHNGEAWNSTVINYSQSSAGALTDNGNFRNPTYPDATFPGVPGIGMTVADNGAAVFRGYVEFPAAGFYTLGVNSDDGFRMTYGDSMGPAKTPVKVLKPASLFGDKAALHCQNGLEGITFGGPLPASPGIIAQAVKADPILAGGPLNNAAAMPGKIAIVQRGGGISFFVKALNCKAAGAIAVVMANNNSDAPGAFGGADSTLNTFPCITMNQSDGDALIAAATTGTDSPVWLRLGDDDSLRLGQFDGGKGSSDVTFGVYVPAAGLYPVRLLWMNGGGDLNCELFSIATDGTKTLLNDPANPIKLWINRSAPTPGTMHVPVVTGNNVSISWTGAGELEMALDIAGPWFKSSWQTSPVVIPIVPQLSQMFFRLRSY